MTVTEVGHAYLSVKGDATDPEKLKDLWCLWYCRLVLFQLNLLLKHCRLSVGHNSIPFNNIPLIYYKFFSTSLRLLCLVCLASVMPFFLILCLNPPGKNNECLVTFMLAISPH